MPSDNPLQPSLRIGLLMCDDVDASAQSQYGTYAQMFRDGLDPSEQHFRLTPIRCFEGEALPQPETYDGYLITGSRFSVYEDLPWIGPLKKFVQQCWTQEIKMVGICFGHQLIAHSLGGETRKADVGWGFGIHSAKLNRRLPWMGNANALDDDRFNLIVVHQDQVVEVPEAFTTIAESEFCPNSIIVAENKMLGIQGHPEFNKKFCAFRAESRGDTIGPKVFDSTMQSLAQNELHADTIWQWIRNFLRQ